MIVLADNVRCFVGDDRAVRVSGSIVTAHSGKIAHYGMVAKLKAFVRANRQAMAVLANEEKVADFLEFAAIMDDERLIKLYNDCNRDGYRDVLGVFLCEEWQLSTQYMADMRFKPKKKVEEIVGVKKKKKKKKKESAGEYWERQAN